MEALSASVRPCKALPHGGYRQAGREQHKCARLGVLLTGVLKVSEKFGSLALVASNPMQY
jgi:hypothetical protein